MYEQVLADLAKGAYLKAFFAALVFVGALAAQGKLTPFLVRLSPWGRTVLILAAVQAGTTAISLDAGVSLVLALGRALPPIAVLLVAHYFPMPAPALPAAPGADEKQPDPPAPPARTAS